MTRSNTEGVVACVHDGRAVVYQARVELADEEVNQLPFVMLEGGTAPVNGTCLSVRELYWGSRFVGWAAEPTCADKEADAWPALRRPSDQPCPNALGCCSWRASMTGAAGVRAQGAGEVVVIPAIVGEAEEANALFERSAAIRKGAGPNVRSTAATTQSVARKASVPPRQLLPEELERWFSHQQEARKQLTLSNYTRAAVSLQAVQDISKEAIEALNREASRARKVLDTCLYLVRSLWETGQTERAEEQARACRQLVPSIEPTLGLHTPDVRGVLQRVDEARRKEAAVRLKVESPRSGCLVRLNGLHLGETPFSMGELVPGEYRVQVECEENRPGRVHRVNLERDETVYIDPTLDTALGLEPEVHLAYVSSEVMAGHAETHGRWLAQHARRTDRALGRGGARGSGGPRRGLRRAHSKPRTTRMPRWRRTDFFNTRSRSRLRRAIGWADAAPRSATTVGRSESSAQSRQPSGWRAS